ncbi:MAG: type II toxin-antitoxin system HigB family toxin [Spirosomataceae bacterium]
MRWLFGGKEKNNSNKSCKLCNFCVTFGMRIIAKSTLRDFWLKHPTAEYPLLDWYNTVRGANWDSPNEVKKTYGSASIVANNRVVFNIKGNTYRLVTEIDYDYQFVFIIWIGTHKEYDKIDVITIEYNG